MVLLYAKLCVLSHWIPTQKCGKGTFHSTFLTARKQKGCLLPKVTGLVSNRAGIPIWVCLILEPTLLRAFFFFFYSNGRGHLLGLFTRTWQGVKNSAVCMDFESFHFTIDFYCYCFVLENSVFGIDWLIEASIMVQYVVNFCELPLCAWKEWVYSICRICLLDQYCLLYSNLSLL